ncbi:unnamed protein product, partial [Prorocentrum cordatum]
MAPPTPARARPSLLVAAAGAALAANAASSDTPGSGFRVVGRGGCRTTSGGSGTNTIADNATTAAECQDFCAKDQACVAFEVRYAVDEATFNPGLLIGGSCEIHTE